MRIRYNVTKRIMGRFRGKVLYPFVLFSQPQDKVTNVLFRHELEHVYQIKRDGWLKFYLSYLYYMVRYGYAKNPYEIAAVKKQNKKLTKSEVKLKNGK